MLGPKNLAVTDYTVALKAALGYEHQLFVSTSQHCEPAQYTVQGLNSGVLTPSLADTALLAAAPAELLAVLDGDVNLGATDLVLSVVGTDSTGAALTGTATVKVPSYAQWTDRVFPKAWAAPVITAADGAQFKTITSVTVVCATDATGLVLRLFGVPPVTTFRQVGAKTQLNYTTRAAEPHSVQIGRDMSKYIKPGEIPEGAMEVTAKIPTFSDGLSRINGHRVTGMVKEVKEDKLETMRIFFFGLILTAKPSTGESVDAATLAANAKFETAGICVAQGAN